MNDLYFACRTCKNYIDAGYRFCYWTLVCPGIVESNKRVNPEAVWSAEEYWRGGDDSDWLAELLPKVRFFLKEHREHDLIFGDDEEIGTVPVHDGDYRVFEWLNEPGSSLCSPELLPRYFVERLGLRTWSQVAAYVENEKVKPWWWMDPEYKARGKAKFVLLVRHQGGITPTLETA